MFVLLGIPLLSVFRCVHAAPTLTHLDWYPIRNPDGIASFNYQTVDWWDDYWGTDSSSGDDNQDLNNDERKKDEPDDQNDDDDEESFPPLGFFARKLTFWQA